MRFFTFIAILSCLSILDNIKIQEEKLSKTQKTLNSSQAENPSSKAYRVGEKLRYRVTYGFVDAGEATLELRESSKKANGKELIHAVGIGKTLGGFNTFYRVYDVYETYLDKNQAVPWYFKRRVDEGGYKISQDYVFNQNTKKVKNEKGKIYSVPTATQDMISSFYHARSLDMRNMHYGKTFDMNVFMDDELFTLKIKYLGDEKITIRKGEFLCHKFGPVMQKGRYFEKEEDVNFWITADANKIPVLVKAKIPVGSVKLQLVEWSGLANPMASQIH